MTARLTAELSLQAGTLAIAARLDVGARGLVLVGPNGAGKTRTLLALLGLTPARGRVAIGERVLADSAAGVDCPPSSAASATCPRTTRSSRTSPPPTTSRSRSPARPPSEGAAARRARARALLGDVGVGASADKRPEMLSGGERQRVALARALAASPLALLLDEPFAALDVETRADLRAFVARTLRALARPFVVVTHDLADAAALGAPIAVMEVGRIVQQGELADLTRAPATAYVTRLVGGAAVTPG